MTTSTGAESVDAPFRWHRAVDRRLIGRWGSESLEALTCAPSSLQSKIESWVAATPIVTGFLCSVERRFSVPAVVTAAVARSLGQAWPQATGEAGAQRA